MTDKTTMMKISNKGSSIILVSISIYWYSSTSKRILLRERESKRGGGRGGRGGKGGEKRRRRKWSKRRERRRRRRGRRGRGRREGQKKREGRTIISELIQLIIFHFLQLIQTS